VVRDEVLRKIVMWWKVLVELGTAMRSSEVLESYCDWLCDGVKTGVDGVA